MSAKDLLQNIRIEKTQTQTNKEYKKFNDLLYDFFKVANLEEMNSFLEIEDGNLSYLSLTYCLKGLLKNINNQSVEKFLTVLEGKKFIYKDEIDWKVIFNSLDKEFFKDFKKVDLFFNFNGINNFWDKKDMFKEENANYHESGLATNSESYEGSYYNYVENNMEKLNYLLKQNIPYSQIKNMFFEAVIREDTATVGRLLHSKYIWNISHDLEVYHFLKLEVKENKILNDFKKEVLDLVQHVDEKYNKYIKDIDSLIHRKF